MDKLRLKFEKTGRAVYISHLDLMRTMQRAFLRSDLPLRYSEGFNPHAQISMILPLPLGHESMCELMDFRVYADCDLKSMPDVLSASLPEGIRVLRAYEPERKGRDLKWLRVSSSFVYDNGADSELCESLISFFTQKNIIITRKTKRGVGEADIRSSIRDFSADVCDNTVLIDSVISAQEPTLNPDHFVSALKQLAPALTPDFARFKRVSVYDSDMNQFE